MHDQVDDAALIAAVRRRLLQEIEHRREAAGVVNNVYGGSGGGVSGMMAPGDSASPDDQDYFVDIMREDLDKDPETGKPRGWSKKVHRYAKKKARVGPTVSEPSLRD